MEIKNQNQLEKEETKTKNLKKYKSHYGLN